MKLSLLILAGLTISAPQRTLVDKVAAVVNDDIVTLSEVKAAAAPYLAQNNDPARRKALYKDVLEQLISERLLAQQIKEADIRVGEADVDRAIKDILRQNQLSDAQLAQALEARGMTMARYREELKAQLIRLKLIDLKVRSRVVIPESDIKAEYESRTAGEEEETFVSISHLFFRWGDETSEEEKTRIKTQAEEARKRVTGSKEDFAAVAKEVSQGPTASQGGSLGEMSSTGLMAALAEPVKGMQVGEVSKPIETTGGIHVVKLNGRRKEKKSNYQKMRAKIHQELYQQRVETQMKLWMDELRKNAAVDVRLDK